MDHENDDEPASLYFASTQIQSRHEDHEKIERSLGKLQKFKNESPVEPKNINMNMHKPPRKTDSKKTRPKIKKPSTSSLSLNAFVREIYRNKKKSDPLSILDYFAGDTQKVDEFLGKIEEAAGRESFSKSEDVSQIHSKHDWEDVLKSIRLRFPGISKRNQKTLNKISQQLKGLQRSSSESTEILQSVWSQASRQPSDDLTKDDVKWLYDLDDSDNLKDLDASLHLSEEDEGEKEDDEEEKPFYLTLSQAMDHSRVDKSDGGEDSLQLVEANTPILISDSESEPEPYIPQHDPTCTDDIPSHQVAGPPESVDVLTSIAFNPKTSKEENPVGTQTQPLVIDQHVQQLPKRTNDSIIFSSPVKPVLSKKPKTPTRWPSNLVITSSPVSSGKETPVKNEDEEVYATAKSDFEETQGTQSQIIESSMPLQKRKFTRKRNFKTSTLEYWGHVEIPEEVLDSIKMRKINAPSEGDEIPDSEESDHEVSLIEISKPSDPIEPPAPRKSPSVLQVPSSPRLTRQSDSFLKLSLLPMKDVREIYQHLGLAPTKLKVTMVEAIEYATELTEMSIDDLLNDDAEHKARQLGEQFLGMLYDKVTNLIKMSGDLHLKMALFEPINIETVAEHLKEQEVFPIAVDLPFLQKYCDEHGVSTTNRPL